MHFASCRAYLCLLADGSFRESVPRVKGCWASSFYSILPQWKQKAIGLVSAAFFCIYLPHPCSAAGLRFVQSLGVCAGMMFGDLESLGPQRWRWLFWIVVFFQSLVYPISASYMRYPVPARTRSTDLREQLRNVDWGGSLLAFGMIASFISILSLGNHTFPWNVSVLQIYPAICF